MTTAVAAAHAFDQAIALRPLGDDRFEGHISAAYWNMVRPFGGITAATALHAVLQHAGRLGQPVALTVNYAAALAEGRFVVVARAARTNRSTRHWSIEVLQGEADGMPAVVLTGSVVTALRRDTWGINDTPMPSVPVPTTRAPGCGMRRASCSRPVCRWSTARSE